MVIKPKDFHFIRVLGQGGFGKASALSLLFCVCLCMFCLIARAFVRYPSSPALCACCSRIFASSFNRTSRLNMNQCCSLFCVRFAPPHLSTHCSVSRLCYHDLLLTSCAFLPLCLLSCLWCLPHSACVLLSQTSDHTYLISIVCSIGVCRVKEGHAINVRLQDHEQGQSVSEKARDYYYERAKYPGRGQSPDCFVLSNVPLPCACAPSVTNVLPCIVFDKRKAFFYSPVAAQHLSISAHAPSCLAFLMSA